MKHAISGYGGPDQLLGYAGADLLRPGFGGDGIYGGSDVDTITYGERSNPVSVSLDEELNDGEAGESDYVASDVENLTGGTANDTHGQPARKRADRRRGSRHPRR